MSNHEYTIPAQHAVSYTLWALGAAVGQVALFGIGLAKFSLPRAHPFRIYMDTHVRVLNGALTHELPTAYLVTAQVVVYATLVLLVYMVVCGASVLHYIDPDWHDPLYREIRR